MQKVHVREHFFCIAHLHSRSILKTAAIKPLFDFMHLKGKQQSQSRVKGLTRREGADIYTYILPDSPLFVKHFILYVLLSSLQMCAASCFKASVGEQDDID